MQFRLATFDEILGVVDLYESVKGEPFCVWTEGYPVYDNALFDQTHSCLYVLEEGGCIIGCLSVEHHNEMDGYPHWTKEGRELSRLAVSKSHRGHGLAGYMVEKIIEHFRGKAPSLHLAASVINVPAYKTYLKAGFQTVGLFGDEKTGYYMMEYDLEEKSE